MWRKIKNQLNNLFLIINKWKLCLYNKKNLSKDIISVLPENLFDSKLKLYMCGTDLFHGKVSPLIEFLRIARLYSFFFNSFFKKYRNSYVTKWLIKNKSIGYFKIMNSNGEILCIRNFLWVFGTLIFEQSFYLGFNEITSEILTEKYLLIIRDIELRYQGSYSDGDITPASLVFEIEGFLPDNREDYLDLKKWDFTLSKSILYPKQP